MATHIVVVTTKTNPELVVTSFTDNPDQRISKLKQDIGVVKGTNEGRVFERFAPFADIPFEDIVFEVYQKQA
jgi:hypothetical protein